MDLKEIFEHKIKIESKVKTIDALFFNEDRVEHTNYHPYYQRNYVWDEEKASYFIESIFLGTEVPPLIFFVNDDNYEVIDGRQRYETITRFLEGKMNLRKSALKKLSNVKGLAGKNFKSLTSEFKDMFLDTKIRTMEFKFLADDHTQDDEEHVKREIFQRYNSGISPLNQQQIDKAIYYDDDITNCFKRHFKKDQRTFDLINTLFGFEKVDLEKLMKKVRELLVLHSIPIKYYAIQKQNIITRFFEYLSDTTEDPESVYNSFIRIVNIVDMLVRGLKEREVPTNRLISECLYWAISIIKVEKEDDLSGINESILDPLAVYLSKNIQNYKTIRSSFSNEVNQRYSTTAAFFSDKFNIDFGIYIKTSQSFKDKKSNIVETKETKDLTFEELRINKPEPTSFEIGDICRQMSRQKFLLRPPYQRNEVIDKKKASAIVESLLLGIKLPPIFVFKHANGVSEVVDGQQRLLAILGFLGKPYKNEKGEDCYSRKNEYRLQLKQGILSELDGKKFSELSSPDQRKIINADLWVIEINGKINPRFDAIDLFVRLNNKPYPIKKDTFEMWNSFISRDIIENIKDIFNKNKGWFYLRKNNSRMENENLITTLAYFNYMESKNGLGENKLYPDKTLDIYSLGDRVSCRLKSKYEITKILEGDDEYDRSHIKFIENANILDFNFISNLRYLCSYNDGDTREVLDDMVAGASGKRTSQNLYILWLLLRGISIHSVRDNSGEIIRRIRDIISMMSGGGDLSKFEDELLQFRQDFFTEKELILFPKISSICELKCDLNNAGDGIIIGDDNRDSYELITDPSRIKDSNSMKIISCSHIRKGINRNYLSCIMMSRYFKALVSKENLSTIKNLNNAHIPYISYDMQLTFESIFNFYKENKTDYDMSSLISRIIDVMVEQLYFSKEFEENGIDLICEIAKICKMVDKDETKIKDILPLLKGPESLVESLLLKAIPIESGIF